MARASERSRWSVRPAWPPIARSNASSKLKPRCSTRPTVCRAHSRVASPAAASPAGLVTTVPLSPAVGRLPAGRAPTASRRSLLASPARTSAANSRTPMFLLVLRDTSRPLGRPTPIIPTARAIRRSANCSATPGLRPIHRPRHRHRHAARRLLQMPPLAGVGNQPGDAVLNVWMGCEEAVELASRQGVDDEKVCSSRVCGGGRVADTLRRLGDLAPAPRQATVAAGRSTRQAGRPRTRGYG